jgi:16S rRNA processing protein RimM
MDSPAERFAAGSVLRHRPGWRLSAHDYSASPPGRLLITSRYADREVADHLRGVYLTVDSASIADPEDPDEFHDHQLVGLRAENPDGDALGEVLRVEHAPASDLLVLRLADGRQGMVPFVRAIVSEVDLPGGRLVMTPPDGLFEL